jgi:hypothetical protein
MQREVQDGCPVAAAGIEDAGMHTAYRICRRTGMEDEDA